MELNETYIRTHIHTHISCTHDGGEFQTSDTTKHMTNPVRSLE